MPPASSGGKPSVGSSSAAASDDDGDREQRESRQGKGIDSINHHLPLASTSSPADDAAAASALSAALLPLLPPASAAWAYGSGVFSQKQQQGRGKGDRFAPRPSVDLLLAVEDPRSWHEDNLRRNPGHYSTLARSGLGGGGPSGICWLAEKVGPGVWFNSGVRVGGARDSDLTTTTTLKYGVFSESALLADLESWGELYLAGRLQKPTLRLLPMEEDEKKEKETTTSGGTESSFAPRLDAALERNAASALAAALLLLPATFSHSRLLQTLVSLSYAGDVRVAAAAEDPRKVERIVRGTGRARLDALYSRHLSPCFLSSSSSSSSSASSSSFPVAAAAGLVPLCGGDAWAQDPRWGSRRELVALLPEGVRRKVEERRTGGSFASSAKGSSPSYFSSSPPPAPSLLAASVRAALASTVRSSSARAALVGLVSAGPAGAARYALAKLKKGGWGGGGSKS